MSRPRVAVAGGGLGGLCLAQGLVRAGVDVRVYERDSAPDVRRQGYRLHMDARAGLALDVCLPPELFRLFLATASRPSRDVVAAIGGYEERMRAYGFAAVEASRQAESQTARRGSPLWLRIRPPSSRRWTPSRRR
jgi:2-polyprenyl-6-methoxyphenol hydroxylase-like FAD-dependent oxidoreductase